MSEHGLYGSNDGIEPHFDDQMDPLGTASDSSFGHEDAVPPASVKIGKTKAKKKLSRGKKIGYGVGAVILVFLGLVVILDPSKPPHTNASPKPPGGVAIAPASAPGQMMGADAPGAGTVMGGGPAPASSAPGSVAAPDQSKVAVLANNQALSAQPPAPAAAAAPAVAPTPPPAPAPTTAPTPVSAPAPAPQSVQTPAPDHQTVAAAKAQPKAKQASKIEASSASPAELASRVAMLERRLARYERAEAQDRARVAKNAATRYSTPATRSMQASSEKLVTTLQPIVETKKMPVLANDTVRVIGVSSRHGVTSALVDFSGAKYRIAPGESVPGLGVVQTIAVDAAGNPVVEINGVRYQ